MIRRVPIAATLVVLAAVAAMVSLGFWQLRRLHWKEALLARYSQAQRLSAEVPWPRDAAAAQDVLYRRSRVDCREVVSVSSVAGRNARDQSGLGHVAQCRLAGGGTTRVVLGWSSDPRTPDWRGGIVTGTIAPGPRLVADPPLAGLAANERPDPSAIPNNHFSYAVQWFAFAVTALVIYALALRKRLRARTVVDSANRR